ncbi:hypothetical protein MM182_00670 [Aeromonas sp. MR19]|uniref:hypothetical protein n=1 Tax=Aeromonas sp. MR19 TaxID=2923421 RepID=UPI001F4B508E|nr:hypothetical protein [Aeromonas sp. MR19]MCH7373909.1 hypothetical protein [Aeromonas sp. MR19]
MHQTFKDIHQNLEKVIEQLKASIPSDEPFGNAHGNWSFPCLTKSELIEEAQSIIDLIDINAGDDISGDDTRLKDYSRRLTHLQQQTIPNLWSSAANAVPAFMITMEGLRRAITPVLSGDSHRDSLAKLKKLASQIRNMESRINGLDPRTAKLATMVERIEQAYNAAAQLPTDLETLSEARAEINELLAQSIKDRAHLELIKTHVDELDEKLNKSSNDAESVLERCETAYSASTSVGLAAAFSERSVTLSSSMWFWIVGLVVALMSGSYFGSAQLQRLSELLKIPDISTPVVALNLLLSMLSVGAPIWFAWLATKQIGQRFRLSEDYAFKASISRAYEGFRREAARFDKGMEAKLLMSALTRLDELPLRLVENTNHGSPWHELASSEIVTQAIKTVPGFAEQVKSLAGKAIDTVSAREIRPVTPATVPMEKSNTA